MAERRIRDEQPIRELEGLDYERCAAVHNHIIELGWTQRGFALDTLDKRTWWDCYGGDAALASFSNRLDASVVSFLNVAWHVFAMGTQPHPFHPFLCHSSASTSQDPPLSTSHLAYVLPNTNLSLQ
jgi:hypothetical protein